MNHFKYSPLISHPFNIVDSNLNHILWFKKDMCIAYVNFDQVKIEPNTLLFTSPSEVFTINAKFCGEIESISFKGKFFESSVNLISSVFNRKFYEGVLPISKLVFSNEQAVIINKLFKKIKIESLKNSPELLEYKSFLDTILMESMNIRMQNNYKYLVELDKFIENQYPINHSVSGYAEQLETRPKKLLGILNNLGAQKPSKVIKERVLLEAKKLLVYTKKSSRDIAFDIGFDDPAYFARFFKKNTGHTAESFRNVYRNELQIDI